MQPRVVITDSSYPDAEVERDVLSSVGAVVDEPGVGSPEEVIEAAEGAHALLNQNVELPASVFEALDSLSVVARYGVGVDNIDVEAATDNDVGVVNVPSYCEDEVATHALAMLLTCVRRTALYDDHVKSGEWDWKVGSPIARLVGSTLGFVAFGNIPRHLADRVTGFDFDLLAYDPYREADALADQGVEKVSFEGLLERSDVVTIHAPLTEETADLFDAEAFERMNDDAVLVNAARGGIVDEHALSEALAADELRSAALDVMAEEPPGDSPLFERDDVILSPHVAWYSESSILELRRKAASGVAAVLQGDQPEHLVNSDAVSLDA